MAKVKKRVVDNWKKKKWYSVEADSVFDNKEICKTVALESKNLIDRNIKKSLEKITNNIKDSGFIITFKIFKVTGGRAETKITDLTSKGANIKRMARREKSKIENIINVVTKDEQKLKLKVLFISGTKFTTELRRESRNIIKEFFETEVREKTLKETWNNIIYQKFSEKLKKKLVKLGYVNKVLVAKATVI